MPPIRIIADVHGAAAALGKVAAEPGPLLVLGDLINFIDYRDLAGIGSDVLGKEAIGRMVALRTAGDFAAARQVWRDVSQGREAELRARWDVLVDEEYAAVCASLEGAEAYVTYGNVDRPAVLRRHLPASARYVDAEVVEVAGVRFGIAGGGTASPLGVEGEVSHEEMTAKLAALGEVDVLGTHVPPVVPALANDVVGGREKGSEAVLAYLEERQPAWHYFGDVHQPQATTWRVGRTRCVNVGYFRATGRAVVHVGDG